MNNDFLDLKNKFNSIKRLGWLYSMRNGPTGVGYTFECLLNKNEDNLQLPDYKSIEIKTIKYFSKRKIHLFNANPQSIFFSPIKTILDNFGYPDKDYPKFNVFNVNLSSLGEKKIGNNYLSIKIDRKRRKIFLCKRNRNNFTTNLNVYWSFDYLDSILRKKLSNLAVVWACYKRENGKDMFFYTKIDFYTYKNIDCFIELLEKGLIEITFKISVFKSGDRFGEIHNRGTDFSINESNLTLLFNKIN